MAVSKPSLSDAIHYQGNDVDDYHIANDYLFYCTHFSIVSI